MKALLAFLGLWVGCLLAPAGMAGISAAAEPAAGVIRWEFRLLALDPALVAAIPDSVKGEETVDYSGVIAALNKEGAEGWQVHSKNGKGKFVLRRSLNGSQPALEYSVQLLPNAAEAAKKMGAQDAAGSFKLLAEDMNKVGEEGWEVTVGLLRGHLCCRPVAPPGKRVQVIPWEYQVLTLPRMDEAAQKADAEKNITDYEFVADQLNKEGAEGWQTLQSSLEAYLLKRPKTEERPKCEFSAKTLTEFEEGRKKMLQGDKDAITNSLLAGDKRLEAEGWIFGSAWRPPTFLCMRLRKQGTQESGVRGQ